MSEKLNAKQKAFCIEYVKDFNGTRAAERSGYAGNDETLSSVASKLLRIAKVRNTISELLEANAMEAGEALWRLAAIARGNISEFVIPNDDGTAVSLNRESVEKWGFLIKAISNGKYGPRIVLYDGLHALELITRHLGLFTDRIDVTTQGQSLEAELSAKIHKIYEAHKAKENQEDQD